MTHDSHMQVTWFSHANLHHTVKVLSPHFVAPLHCLRVQLGCFGYIQEWWKNLRLTNCVQVTCKSCDIRKSRCGSPNVPLNVSSCFINADDIISPRWKYFRKVCSSRTIMKQKSRSRALRPKMSTASWGGARRGSEGGGGGEGRRRREVLTYRSHDPYIVFIYQIHDPPCKSRGLHMQTCSKQNKTIFPWCADAVLSRELLLTSCYV